jgi:hypothetical protein
MVSALAGEDRYEALVLRERAGVALRQAGRAQESCTMLEAWIAHASRVLGPDHLDTMRGRGALIDSYEAVGRMDEAAVSYQRLVDDCMRVLGPRHEETLKARNNLGIFLMRSDRGVESRAVFEALLPDVTAVYGEKSDIARKIAEYAVLVDPVGWLADPANKGKIPPGITVYQKGDPTALRKQRNWVVYCRQGGVASPAECITDLSKLLAQYVSELGEHHPDTLETRLMLAEWQVEAGERSGAIAGLQTFPTDLARILPNDPDRVLRLRSRLGSLSHTVGQPLGAAWTGEHTPDGSPLPSPGGANDGPRLPPRLPPRAS